MPGASPAKRKIERDGKASEVAGTSAYACVAIRVNRSITLAAPRAPISTTNA